MAEKTVPAGEKVPLVAGSGTLAQGIEIVDDSMEVSRGGVYLFGVNCNLDVDDMPGDYDKRITITKNGESMPYSALTVGGQAVKEHVALSGTLLLVAGDRVAVKNDTGYTLLVNDLTFWLYRLGFGS